MQCLTFAQGGRTGEHDGEDILFANAPGDELRILRTEIEDYDCLGVHSLVWQGVGRAVKALFPGAKCCKFEVPATGVHFSV
jgi:hypothetical protein